MSHPQINNSVCKQTNIASTCWKQDITDSKDQHLAWLGLVQIPAQSPLPLANQEALFIEENHGRVTVVIWPRFRQLFSQLTRMKYRSRSNRQIIQIQFRTFLANKIRAFGGEDRVRTRIYLFVLVCDSLIEIRNPTKTTARVSPVRCGAADPTHCSRLWRYYGRQGD